ncbi:pleckstriny domain-containing family A member 1-like X9, partial [Biomphalaria glabrata]
LLLKWKSSRPSKVQKVKRQQAQMEYMKADPKHQMKCYICLCARFGNKNRFLQYLETRLPNQCTQ